jgi:hypothetical protein
MNIDFLKKLNISSLAKTTSNTLNVIKKTIPIYKEIKPYISKEKKLIKNNEIKKESIEESDTYNDSLTFFQ